MRFPGLRLGKTKMVSFSGFTWWLLVINDEDKAKLELKDRPKDLTPRKGE